MAAHESEAATEDGERAGTTATATTIEAMPSLDGSPDDIAALLHERPAQRELLLRALHAQRGNAFVAQVLAAVPPTTAPPTAAPAQAIEDDDSGSPGPTGARFAGDGKLGDVERGTATLKVGDTGRAVRKVQQALFEMNCRPIDVSGVYDQVTADHVKRLQQNLKLGRTDGVLDGETFKQIEQRFYKLDRYARSARGAPPGMHGNPKWRDADNPEQVLLTETHALDADTKTEANEVISPAKAGGTVGPLVNKAGYEASLEKLLQDKIDREYRDAKQDQKDHDKGKTFSMDAMVNLGNAAKGEVDKVFGSWAVGDPMKAGVTLKDRFTADRADQAAMKPDKKRESAKSRARYFTNTGSAFEELDEKHSADRTRATEQQIISAVLDRIAQANEEKLLLITATWSASTDRKGIIKIQRMKTGDDDQDRALLWQKFGTMIHEYLHSITHPRWHAHRDAKGKTDPQGGHTLGEGVTELLTRIVVTQINLADKKLRAQVLNGIDDDGEEPELERDHKYSAAYARAQALAGVVGIHNIFAAYFLGQTQLIGA